MTTKSKWLQFRTSEKEKDELLQLCKRFDPEKTMSELFWIAIDLLKLKIANLGLGDDDLITLDALYGPDYSYARLTTKDIDKLKSIEQKVDQMTELFKILLPDHSIDKK